MVLMNWRCKWDMELFAYIHITINTMILLSQYGQAKGQIVEKDITFKMVDIEYITNEALNSVTKSVRRSASDMQKRYKTKRDSPRFYAGTHHNYNQLR
jgi:hypothetical protein